MLKKKDDEGLKVSTRQRLIDIALIELDKNGLSGFDLDDLLAKSKISKGSLLGVEEKHFDEIRRRRW